MAVIATVVVACGIIVVVVACGIFSIVEAAGVIDPFTGYIVVSVKVVIRREEGCVANSKDPSKE